MHVRFRLCLLHMLPRRAVVAAGTGRLRPTPDALAVTRPVAVLACGRMVAARAVANRTAPLAARGIVAVFVLVQAKILYPWYAIFCEQR